MILALPAVLADGVARVVGSLRLAVAHPLIGDWVDPAPRTRSNIR